ncbi:MAG: hypothetical protein FWH36_06575 [Lentimicrobiaceae bacterium]|nr:hypothetical protein [Lentimicrobiaceae bacterium]
MKKQDVICLLATVLFFLPFFTVDAVYEWYKTFNASHYLIMAFLKFGILATYGEVLGLRIKTGKYNAPHFGILPRAVVWGLFGVWIAAMMGIFKTGVPAFLDKMGLCGLQEAFNLPAFSGYKLLGAFGISVVMNATFAPVFMTLHKITDTHIGMNFGRLESLITPIKVTKIITSLNWDVQWNFVFKKTIPFFWIPAHTLTFILPSEYQVLFAALLGIALGLILSIASLKSEKKA